MANPKLKISQSLRLSSVVSALFVLPHVLPTCPVGMCQKEQASESARKEAKSDGLVTSRP